MEDEETLEEETKYKLKIPNSSPEPSGDDFSLDGGGEEEDLDFGDEDSGDLDLGDEEGGDESSDKPFDDEPFDADVEASEEDDPEKYIQQLSGKLGQSMRKHSDETGEPDFDLEKFAINSVISASHSAEMDDNDQDDIINKVKSSGRGEGGEEESDMGDELDMSDEDLNMDGDEEEMDMDMGDGEEELDMGDEGGLDEDIEMSSNQEHGRDQYNHSEFDKEEMSNCCGAKIIMGDRCADCGDHTEPYAGEEEEVSLEEVAVTSRGQEHWALFGNIGEQIRKTKTIEDLTETFKFLYSKIENENAQDALIYFFNERKGELEQTGLNMSENFSIFVKNTLREMTEPVTKPKEKETEVRPTPSRTKRTFEPIVQPNVVPKFGEDEEEISAEVE